MIKSQEYQKDVANINYYRAIANQEWRLPAVKEEFECNRGAVEGTRLEIRKEKRYLHS